MALSQRLKQARLEAGLSQKALCGDRITRNMLSQIENGSAHPSMDTLRYLAGRLGKPVSYFLEEQTVTSPNQALMQQLRQASPEEVLTLLPQYRQPDALFDPERFLLEVLACLALAAKALDAGKTGYAQALLVQAQAAGAQTPYYTEDLHRRNLLLLHRAGGTVEETMLPDWSEELLLRAELALNARNFPRCEALLACAEEKSVRWHYLKARMHFAQAQYAPAREHFEAAWDLEPLSCCARLEDCCRELSDFAGAYFYACKLRELNRF